MSSEQKDRTLHCKPLPAALLALALCALVPPFVSAKLTPPRSASTPSTSSTERSDSTTFQPFNLSTSSYVWGLDLDGTRQGAGGVGGLLAVIVPRPMGEGQGEGGTAYLPCYDANGNITEYVSTNGEVVAHYDYSPFGETLVASGPLADSFTHRAKQMKKTYRTGGTAFTENE